MIEHLIIIIFCASLSLSVEAVTDILVSNHPICTEMGKQYLEKHNVTVPELAIIISTCEGIVNPQYSGLGGGFIATVYNGNCQESRLVNAREKSPVFYTSRTEESFEKIGIPSMIKGYWYLYKMNMCGIRSVLNWKDLFAENIILANNYWPIAKSNNKFVNMLNEIPNHTIEISNDGKKMANPTLARTLRHIANHQNPQTALDHYMTLDLTEINSQISGLDLQNHKITFSNPDKGTKFLNYTIVASLLPGSGFTFIFGSKIVEAVLPTLKRLSLEDRTLFMYHTLRFMYSLKPFLRSPHVNQDKILLEADVIANDILNILNNTWDPTTIRQFGRYRINLPVRHKRESGTANIIIRRGKFALTMTSTINSYYGSKYFSRVLGFPYNDQLRDFDEVGSANGPASAKTPQSATSAIIMYSNKHNPVFQIGGAGGSKMIGAVFNTFFNYFVNNMPLNEANEAPRCTPQYNGLIEYAICENNISKNIKNRLKRLGVNVTNSKYGFGGVTASSTVKNFAEATFDKRRDGETFISAKSSNTRRANRSIVRTSPAPSNMRQNQNAVRATRPSNQQSSTNRLNSFRSYGYVTQQPVTLCH